MDFFSLHTLISLLVSLLPVLVFLVALLVFDTFKLMKLRTVLYLILTGSVVAFICMWFNSWLLDVFNIPGKIFLRYLAPVIEETFKAIIIFVLIRRRRVGFMVDSAIAGFAVGAGFAIVENLYYFKYLADSNLFLWIVRGFGTAIMHGGTTALVGIISKYFADRYGSHRLFIFPSGLVIAIIIHSAYNHFFLSPLLSTLGILVVLPLLIAFVFRRSENATRDWLGVKFDTDQELLGMINTGQMSQSRIGHYLQALKERFAPEVLFDMVCLIRLHLELSIRAKGILLMREAGFKEEPSPEIRARFAEMRYLEKSIGRTGLLAISPIFNMSDRDLWQLYMLGKD